MLAISPLRSNKDGHDKEGAMEANFSIGPEDFPNFSGSNLLDNIDFDDLFMGMHDGDILPDLEMDPELLAEFSISSNTCGEDESSDANNSSSADIKNVISLDRDDGNIGGLDACETNKDINDDGDFISQVILYNNEEIKGEKTPVEEIKSKNDVKVESITSTCSLSCKEAGEKRKRLSSNSKNNNSNNDNNNNQAKRKTKVDWTPELHRRFVQVVEQLGVDKAVPSRILELMGVDCLTRHNIASHLQKYRSHRKHLLAGEAEAANWTQKRQMYSVAMVGGKGGANVSAWYPPTMGFLPMATVHPSFRPLHVWGHPTMDTQSRMPMWLKQIVPSTSTLPPAWAPHPPVDPSFWNSFQHHRVGVAAGSGISPHHTMLRPDQHGLLSQQPPQSSGSNRPLELHPSKESIDAAIGDILAKPWQPLPIGLKPPSTDSVMVELQRQGIPKIPPSCA